MSANFVSAAALFGAVIAPAPQPIEEPTSVAPVEQATAAEQPPESTTAAPATPAPASGEAQPAKPCCNIPALTPIELEIVTAASSKTSAIGDKVELRVLQPVSIDGRVVIPAGTQGFAEVIQASKARIGGKAGELSMGLTYLMLNGQRIGLKRFAYGPSSGADRGTQAVVATALIGIAGMFISGGNIDVHSGARANAVVTRDTFVPVQP